MVQSEQANTPVYTAVAVDEGASASHPFASATAVAMPTATVEHIATATAIGVEIPVPGAETQAHLAYRARMQQYMAQSIAEPGVRNANDLIEDDWGSQVDANRVRNVAYCLLLVLVVAFVGSVYLFTLADDTGALQSMDMWVAERLRPALAQLEALGAAAQERLQTTSHRHRQDVEDVH